VHLGLVISALLHAFLIVWAVISIESTTPLKSLEEKPVEVSIVSTLDLETRQRKGSASAKQLEAASAPKPTPAKPAEAQQEAPKPPPPAALPPPPPPPVAKEDPPPPPEPQKAPEPEKVAALATPPPPTPGPAPDEQKLLEDKLKEAEKLADAEAKARAEAQAKAKAEADAKARAEAAAKAKAEADAKAKAAAAAKAKAIADAKAKAIADAKAKAIADAKKFDPNKIESLLKNAPDEAPPEDLADKDPRKRGAVAAESPSPTNSRNKGPVAGTAAGTDTRLTAREEDMMKNVIQSALDKCWNKPAVGGGDRVPVVKIKWRMRQDGSVEGVPQVVDRVSSPLMQAAADAAVRAVVKCERFALPPDKYAAWRDITWEFDPNK
jgi:colicin import membrane protein